MRGKHTPADSVETVKGLAACGESISQIVRSTRLPRTTVCSLLKTIAKQGSRFKQPIVGSRTSAEGFSRVRELKETDQLTVGGQTANNLHVNGSGQAARFNGHSMQDGGGVVEEDAPRYHISKIINRRRNAMGCMEYLVKLNWFADGEFHRKLRWINRRTLREFIERSAKKQHE